MDQNRFELMVNNTEIYPLKFVEQFGRQNYHWMIENWLKREHSLRHDMCSALLCNLKPSENFADDYINMLKRVRENNDEEYESPRKVLKTEDKACAFEKMISLEPSTSQAFMDVSDQEDLDEPDLPSEEDDNEDEYLDEKKIIEITNKEQMKYAYILIEGSERGKVLQGYYAEKWGVGNLNKIFDIIDTMDKKFVEVKVTINFAKALNENLELLGLQHTGLVLINPIDGDTKYHNCSELPGHSKMMNFILKRHAELTRLGLRDEAYLETETVDENLFKGDSFTFMLDSFSKIYLEGKDRELDLSQLNTKGFKLTPIDKKDLFEKMDKVIDRKCDKTVCWKGKLTPFFYCDPILLEDEFDEYSVDHFLQEIDFKSCFLIKGDQSLIDAIEEIKTKWVSTENEGRHFGLFNLKDKINKVPKNLTKYLGIGAKGKIHNPCIENAKQPESTPLGKMNYSRWFEDVYETLCRGSPYTKEYSLKYEHENKDRLRHHNLIKEWVINFYKVIGHTNLGCFISQVKEFYSRVASAYNTHVGKTTTHSRVAVIPLKFITNKHDEKGMNTIVRRLTGIAIRGPQHTKSATDRINLIFIEKIKIEKLPKDFYEEGKHTIFLDKSCNSHYLIRQCAIKKIDGMFLTFIHNSLFIATNMLGDMMLKHPLCNTFSKLHELCRDYFNHTPTVKFLLNRVNDAVLMAVLGNSRDEGYFSMLRKLFMILINSRRGHESFTFNLDEFCEKINENLLDNPFSMFFHISVLYTLTI